MGIAEKQVIFVDTKVDSTQAALLDKLKIYPFEYKMKVTKILQNENIFDAAVLDLSTDIILEKFKRAVGFQTAIALEASVPTGGSGGGAAAPVEAAPAEKEEEEDVDMGG